MSSHWDNPVAQELLDRREHEVTECVREQALRGPERSGARDLEVSILPRIRRLLMRRPCASIADVETWVPVQPQTSSSGLSRSSDRRPEEVSV
jgi:hypothetical protein